MQVCDGEAPGSLRSLPGLGPARVARLASIGIGSLRDLMLALPARVEVGAAPVPIAEARERAGEVLTLAGEVGSWRLSRFGRRSLLRVALRDASGTIDVLFFNQPWLRERFTAGAPLEVRGRVDSVQGPALTALKLGTPEHPLPAPGSVVPSYATPKGMSSELLAGFVAEAVRRHGDTLREPLDAVQLERLGLPALPGAVRDLHAPSSLAAFAAARRRVVFESLLALQARLAARRLDRDAGDAPPIALDAAAARAITARFPFTLTGHQARAIEELSRDLARKVPMRRLLQGDVGSGKTAVGAWACLAAACAGLQAAFMAPTELLAEQHRAALAELFERAGVRAVLLTGSLPPPARRAALAAVASGAAQVVFGTHALFSDDVRFARLGLAVIDEQHRFGVAQRRALLDKGRDVHALLMTATPIPRSLALTLYGDLDVSVLREKPPGRGRVRTRWLRGAKRRKLESWLAERLEAGEQVFWVVPRIEAGEGADSEGAEERFERLARSPLARHGVDLVHGRLEAAERAGRLARFRAGEVRLLVATTVIEVGVDVPAASVMVIEEAQRLGLAQLHQLRGRVGRGGADAWCFLLGKAAGAERFATLEATDDGFAIAEEDLRRRGMGDLIGLRQAGANAEGLDDPERDLELLFAARDLVREDPELRRRCLAAGATR